MGIFYSVFKTTKSRAKKSQKIPLTLYRWPRSASKILRSLFLIHHYQICSSRLPILSKLLRLETSHHSFSHPPLFRQISTQRTRQPIYCSNPKIIPHRTSFLGRDPCCSTRPGICPILRLYSVQSIPYAGKFLKLTAARLYSPRANDT